MIQTIIPGERSGTIHAPSSKSMAHRHLICAALSANSSTIDCPGISKDIEATAACLNAMGAQIAIRGEEISVNDGRTGTGGILLCNPNAKSNNIPILQCGESGSTLRFLLPVVGALGMTAAFKMAGRLPQRPMREYEALLALRGMCLERDGDMLHCSGQLNAGEYVLPGNISSQYFSGLLFALPLLSGDSRIVIEGELESEDYFELTKDVVAGSGISFHIKNHVIEVPGSQKYAVPDRIRVEGDYSSAAFFLCLGALSRDGVCVRNLNLASGQGDRRITEVLEQFGAQVSVIGTTEFCENLAAAKLHGGICIKKGDLRGIDIDASMIPDLIPVLSVVAALAEGTTTIYNAQRLRMKESDRIASTAQMLLALGADVQETRDGLRIHGKPQLLGGTQVDPCNDHRIAMSAAIAACASQKPVQIRDAQCVEKSYPDFWKDLDSLHHIT